MAFINICGPIVANTAYIDNELVGKDVEATLPEVTPVTGDIEAMGTMALPIWQRIEDMTFAITKIGVDLGLGKMIKPQTLALELRFVQDVIDANANTSQVGLKAFIKCIPTLIPGIAATVGEASANEISFTVTRYQLFAGGVEMFLIDRLAGIVRIGGIDYTKQTNSLL